MIGHNNANNGSAYFSGSLDSVRVYGRALTAGEIAGVFASP